MATPRRDSSSGKYTRDERNPAGRTADGSTPHIDEVGQAVRSTANVFRPDAAPVASPQRASAWEAPVAFWLFVVFVVVAGSALVLHIGRYYWFNGDEFDLLANGDAGKLADLLRAHNEHLVLVQVLVYRLLWHFVGMRSYLPYQMPVMALHLTAAVLLRTIMRRGGRSPWIATAAA